MCKKILIVDDDLTFVNRLINNFLGYDFSISIASSISQAKSVLEREEFDIILANRKVPGGEAILLKEDIKNRAKLLLMSSLNDTTKNNRYIFKHDFINNFKGYFQSV